MEIANLKVYNDNMRKSLLDKAYFLSFVDSDTFIDFGCADGSLLKHIHEMFPDKKLIGYDISPEMLQVAEKNLEGCNVSLYNNFENVISLKLDNATLILSSVIHEVYSYGDNQSVNEFWRQVFNENFRYIAIRDLTPWKSIDRMSDINDVSRHCDILVRSDDAETIKYSGTLSQSQVEHIVFLIQDNYSGKDIKDQIIEYEVQSLSPTVTSQIGDPEFLEE